MPRSNLKSQPTNFFRHTLLGLVFFVFLIVVVGIAVVVYATKIEERQTATSRFGKTITLQTSDHVRLTATLFEPEGVVSQAIVLAPTMEGSRNDWEAFAEFAHDLDRAVLAFDWRLNTRGALTSSQDLALEDWPLLEQDVHAAVNFIRSRYPSVPLVLMGASLGANFSLKTALSITPEPAGVVLLSPGLSYRGIEISSDITRYARPLFLVVSNDDEYAASSSLTLFNDSVSSSKSLKQLSGAGHGTMMLQKESRLGQDLLNWMAQL